MKKNSMVAVLALFSSLMNCGGSGGSAGEEHCSGDDECGGEDQEGEGGGNEGTVKIVSTLDTPGRARSLFLLGDYVYLADGNGGGLQIIDVTEPASPSIVSEYATSGDALDVYVVGEYAYVADGAIGGLLILDVSDPASPELAGSVDTSGQAKKVHVQGDFAYVADGTSGVQIVDVSDKTAPSIVGTYNEAPIPESILDIKAISVWGDHVLAGGDVHSDVSGLYGESGFLIIDVSTPSEPSLAAAPELVHADHIPIDFVVAGDYLYTAACSGLVVWNVADMTEPVLVGTSGVWADTTGIALLDGEDHAYFSLQEDEEKGYFYKVDISEKSVPLLSEQVELPDMGLDVAANVSHAFVAASNAGLLVIEK